jgi:hypothetical protein
MKQKLIAMLLALAMTMTLTACGSHTSADGSGSAGSSAAPEQAAANSVDLAAFYDDISSREDFPAMMALTGELLDSFYAGLNDLNPKQCIVYTPMISAVAAEFAMVEVSGAADVQKVKEIFQARIDYQIEQGAFYPATVEAWESSAKIVSNGNYVLLVCFSECDDVVSSFNALFA